MKKLNRFFAVFFAAAFVTSVLFVTGCSTSKVQSKSSGNQLVMDSSIKQGKLDNGMSYFIRENGEPKNRIQLRLVVKTGFKSKCKLKKSIKELGATEYTFENGVKIITKKTNFQKNAITIYGGSKGGYYQLKEEEIP